jgi:hypothetical protein
MKPFSFRAEDKFVNVFDTLEIDDDRSCYCFCNEQKWCQIFDENSFDIIFKRSSQHLSTLFLIRPKRKLTDTTPLMIQIKK